MSDRPQGMATDVANRDFMGAQDPDAIMVARFYLRAEYQPFRSEKEGRPIYEDKIYCEYGPAGSTLLKMDVPSTNIHEQRFRRQWEHFKSGQTGDAREVGTPLAAWPILTPAGVEELRAQKFYTVDNIAGASDELIQRLGMGVNGMSPTILRARAQAFLSSATATAQPQAHAAEIEKLKQEAKATADAHAAEMAELRAMILGKGTTPQPTAEPEPTLKLGLPHKQKAATAEM